MIETRNRGLLCLEHPPLKADSRLFHGHFTRVGGVSDGPFASLNVGIGLEVSDDFAMKNRQSISDLFTGRPVVSLKQVHGTRVLAWERTMEGHEPVEADAVVTNEDGILLMIQTADCQPVFLYDPVQGVIGNVHAGWRGSIADIVGKTVGVMVDRFGCKPSDMMAGVGPSLGPCCAEFVNYRNEIPERYWGYKDDKDHFDFWAISRDQLAARGLRNENISVGGMCTVCNKDLFFSYRRDRLTGRLAHVIGMWPDNE